MDNGDGTGRTTALIHSAHAAMDYHYRGKHLIYFDIVIACRAHGCSDYLMIILTGDATGRLLR